MAKSECEYNKLIIQNIKGESITIEIHWEANVTDWVEAFRAGLTWVSFHPDTIAEALGDAFENRSKGHKNKD